MFCGHTEVQHLKDRIEQAGAKVASMAKYKNPQADRPGYLITMLSNHGPKCGSPPPAGSHRRLCYLKLLNVHGARASDALEDPDLKAEFIAGKHVLDIFHLVRLFFPRLMDYKTNIDKPSSIDSDTKEALGCQVGESDFDKWVQSKFVAAPSPHEGSLVKDVKKLFMAYFEVKKQQVEVPMRNAGFICKTRSGGTYCVYQFPLTDIAVPIKVKPLPVADEAVVPALA